MALFGLFNKDKAKALDKGLAKTKVSLLGQIGKLFLGKSQVDDATLDALEEILISADVGVNTTLKIIDRIQSRVSKQKYSSPDELNTLLKEEIADLLAENKAQDTHAISTLPVRPYVVMVVGVNGVGKTTTIGKLATLYHKAGLKVILGAADTFRAAAVDQLKLWGQRVGVPVVDHGMQSDPAAVAYDTLKKAVEMNADVAIIDTAGRLHTKVNLMNELSKIRRVMDKVLSGAPHEVLLVLDGSTGQNAMIQAREFTKATEVSALAITKLDGTAKGGVVIGISDEFKIPVKYIGVGEQPEDLQLFDKMAYVESLFSNQSLKN